MKLKSTLVKEIAFAVSLALSHASVSRVEAAPSIDAIEAPFAMPELSRPVFPDHDVNLLDHGAVEGGEVINETAVQAAIDTCSSAGGGRVVVPAGKWLSAPIVLKSHVNLYLSEGAELWISSKKHYFFPDEESRVNQDMRKPKYPITADHCENIAITGPGKLDGGGIGWWPLHPRWWNRAKGELPASIYETAWEGLDAEITHQRPQMFRPFYCTNVWLEGVTFANSPFWTVNPVACENVIIRDVTVVARASETFFDSPNTDGINPESCRNVLVENCNISTGDDSFAIKSGKDEEGRERGIPSENIVIRNCNARRIAIGSEMSGGIRNVFIHHVTLSGDDNQVIHVKTRRGRGNIVENVWIQDITISSRAESVLRVDMEYWTHMVPAPPEPVSKRTPRFRNLFFKNIQAIDGNNRLAIFVNGLPEMPIEHMEFEDIRVRAKAGVVCNYANGVAFRNVELTGLQQTPVSINNSRDVRFHQLEFGQWTGPLVSLKGEATEHIVFDPSWRGKEAAIALEEGASQHAIEIKQP